MRIKMTSSARTPVNHMKTRCRCYCAKAPGLLTLLTFLLPFALLAAPRPHVPKPEPPPASAIPKDPTAALLVREIRYDGRVSDEEARFIADISLESLADSESSATLFEGELALLPPKLPAPLRIERAANQYRLIVSKPGRYQFKLKL